MKKLLVIGADIEVIELIHETNEYEIIGVIDSSVKGKYYSHTIIGNDDFIIRNKNRFVDTKVIITIDDVNVKKRLYFRYKKAGFEVPSLISPNAKVSNLTEISEGTIIQADVNIGPNVKIGLCSKINIKANIMHDGIIGNFCTIAPNAITLGYVKIDENVFIGANSTILPRVIVQENIIIGAGSVVTQNLSKNAVYAGNPAKLLRKIY